MKKLLGLLTIAPLSLAACGSAEKDTSIDQTPIVEDTVIINNDVRYSETDNVLILTHFTLESYDDFTGYNEIGTALQNAYTENPEIGKATKVHLEGEVGGVTKNYDINVNGILDDTDGATYFTNFQGAIDHNWTTHGDYTGEAYFAKHVIEAGDHIVPTSSSTAERAEISTKMKAAFNDPTDDNKYYSIDSEMTFEDFELGLNTDFSRNPGYTEFTGLDDIMKYSGISQDTLDMILDVFENTYFVFEGLAITKNGPTSINWLNIAFHHEYRPSLQWKSSSNTFIGVIDLNFKTA